MFNLGYNKKLNKRRPYLIRGKKKRYSVYRAELNIKLEDKFKFFCEKICERLQIDISDVQIEHPDFPWAMTNEYLEIITKSYPYKFSRYVLTLYSEEDLEILRENVKIAEEYRKSQDEQKLSQKFIELFPKIAEKTQDQLESGEID